jgi:hypothetical protein
MLKAEEQKRVGSATRTTGKSPVEMIAQERQAQILLGYDATHDDQHAAGELAAAAACFAIGSTELMRGVRQILAGPLNGHKICLGQIPGCVSS